MNSDIYCWLWCISSLEHLTVYCDVCYLYKQKRYKILKQCKTIGLNSTCTEWYMWNTSILFGIFHYHYFHFKACKKRCTPLNIVHYAGNYILTHFTLDHISSIPANVIFQDHIPKWKRAFQKWLPHINQCMGLSHIAALTQKWFDAEKKNNSKKLTIFRILHSDGTVPKDILGKLKSGSYWSSFC